MNLKWIVALVIPLIVACSDPGRLADQKKQKFQEGELKMKGTGAGVRAQEDEEKAFFAKGIFGVDPEDFELVAELGFNVVNSYNLKSLTMDGLQKYMDKAHKNGLKVLFSIGGNRVTNASEKNSRLVNEMVTTFKSHPALYGWYLFDEPNPKKGVTPERLKEVYQKIKELDPDHQVFVSNWLLKSYADGTDVDMRQIYFGRPSAMKADLDGDYIELVGRLKKDWIAIVNTHDSRFNDDVKNNPLEYCNTERYYVGANEKKDKAEYDYRERRAKLLSENLSNPFDGLKDERGLAYKYSRAFPATPSLMQAQWVTSLVHGSDAGIFWWIWQRPDKISLREGYYTFFHFEATKDYVKPMLSEVSQIGKLVAGGLTKNKMWHDQNLALRYLEAEGQAFLLVVNESKNDFVGKIELPGEIADFNFESKELKINFQTDVLELKKETSLILKSTQ